MVESKHRKTMQGIDSVIFKIDLHYLRTLLLWASIVLLVVISASAQPDATDLKNDLKIFRKALEDTHPNLYRFTPKRIFDTTFDSIDRQITTETHALEFYRLLSRIESLVREGHTFLTPSDELAHYIQQQKLLPFHVSVNDSTITIKTSFDEPSKVYERKKICVLNGKKSGEILNMIANATGLKSGYNNSALWNTLSYENNFAYAYYCFIDTASTFVIEFDDGTRSQIIRGLVNAESQSFPRSPGEPDPPIKLVIDQANKSALMTITTFAHWMVSFSKRKYVKTFSNCFRKMEEAGVRHLIIDLRDNRGGEEMLVGELLTYILKSDFRIYRRMRARTLNFEYNLDQATKLNLREKDYTKTDSGYYIIKHEVLKTFKPKINNHFDGALYVLSNGGSRSAANTMLSLIRTHNAGIIVGQESGGVYEDVDGRKRILLTLPASKIQVSFPVWSFKVDSRNGDPFRGVIPDYVVGMDELEDAARDSTLRVVYNLIGEK